MTTKKLINPLPYSSGVDNALRRPSEARSTSGSRM